MEALRGVDAPGRMDAGAWIKPCAIALAVALALGLSGCGGGGGGGNGNTRPTTPPAPPPATAGFSGGQINVDANSTLVLPDNYSGSINLVKGGAGTLTLTGTNGYSGGTTISDGTLQLGNGGATGSIAGDVLDNSLLVFNRSDDVTFAGVISGTGALKQAGTGALILTGASTFTGGTTVSSGTLQLGDGGTSGSIGGGIVNNGTLAFNRSDDISFANVITGTGGLIKSGNNALTLTGANSYTGTTQIRTGTLYVDGNQLAATGETIVSNGATLGGTGALGGNVTLSDGATLSPGDNGGIGTLTMGGNLRLSAGTKLDFNLAQAAGGIASGDLVNVHGNVLLDGTLSISGVASGSLGPGVVHRLFNYDGTLLNNGLDVAGTSSGFGVQTGVANQINLLNTQGMQLSFWDGSAGPKGNNLIDGGSGTWQSGALSNDNWTDANGAVNSQFASGAFAVFQAKPGTVTVDASRGDIDVAGMQFVSDGYIVQGDTIHLVGSTANPSQSIIRVGAGDAGDAHVTATINSVLDGSSALVKTDAGNLVLGGNNTYTGGTAIRGGTLQIGAGGTSGSIAGDVANDASLVFDRSDNPIFAGSVSGSGSLTQAGSGTLILTGASTYSGGTTISKGILQLGNGGATGSIAGDVLDNGTLAFNQSADATFGGVISGNGKLVQAGTNKLTLLGANTYTGGTTIAAGTLQLGDGIHTGTIAGDVANSGSFVFNPADDLTYAGIISGSGSFTKMGPGTLKITGANTFSGGTVLNGGSLEIAPGAVLGTGSITVYGSFATPSPTQMLKVDAGASVANPILMGGAGWLDNAGRIGGSLDVGVGGPGSLAMVQNHDGGSIMGNQSAIQFTSYGSISNQTGGRIDGGNFAVVMTNGGSVANDGLNSLVSSTSGTAIRVTGNAATVQNTGGGTIASKLTPLWLEHGGKVTNGAGSVIRATGATDGDCGAAGICSIYVASASSVPSSADGGLTLSNAGDIFGNVQMIPTAYNNVTLTAGGSIHGDLLAGSNTGSFMTLNGDAGTTQSYSQAVTGRTSFAGLLTKKGAGTWVIDSDDLNSIAHVEVAGGILQVGNGAATGSIGSSAVQLDSGTALVIDRSDDVQLGLITRGDSTGRAAIVQSGSGKLTLANLGVLSNFDVTVANGTLQFGTGLTDYIGLGSRLSVVNNGSLIFDYAGQTYFDSAISGGGTLTKNGPGTLVLGSNSSNYTGDTIVNGGTLAAMGFLRNVFVNPGATLKGAVGYNTIVGLRNTLGNLSNAGTVAVSQGNAVVVGNYSQSASGTLAVSLGSQLSVNGTATLNGGTLQITGAEQGYVANTHTPVLTAGGGLTGTFDQLVKGSGVVFTATTINYDGNSAWLDTTGLNVTTAAAGNGVTYTPASFASAQRVQAAFTQLDNKIASHSLSTVSADFVNAAGQFQQAPSLQAAQESLKSLSGQLYAASAAMTFETIDASSRALAEHFDDVLGNNGRAGMWMQDLNVGGGMERSGYDGVGFQLNGWLVGHDRQIGNSGVAGFAFGQSQGLQHLSMSYDRNRSRNTEGMLYAGWLNGNWYAMGRAGFGHFRQDVNRQLLLGVNAQSVSTTYSGNYSVAYGETGLHLSSAGIRITPFANVEYASIQRDGFAEEGAGGFGLRTRAQLQDRWQAGLGLRAGRHWDISGGRALDLQASARFMRTFASRGDVFDASFVGLQQWQPLAGIGLSRRSGVLSVGLNAKLSADTSMMFGYDYEKGQRDQAQMVSARMTMAF